jgi:hypothetical protein
MLLTVTSPPKGGTRRHDRQPETTQDGGDATEVLVVKTNPGYSPAKKGTGKVVAVVCKT